MKAGALENIIKQSQVEIIELKHSMDDLRYLLLALLPLSTIGIALLINEIDNKSHLDFYASSEVP